jgi:hypothetical protein
MTHHTPLCEDLACEVCAEPDCSDRQEPYEVEPPWAPVLHHLGERVDALEQQVAALSGTVDRVLAAVVRAVTDEER